MNAISEEVASDYRIRMARLRTFAKMEGLSQRDVRGRGGHWRGHKDLGCRGGRRARLHAQGSLPRSRRRLQGWNRLDPGTTRPPIPWELIAAVVHRMLTKQQISEGFLVLLMFDAYLRPGEAISLHRNDLVEPTVQHPHFLPEPQPIRQSSLFKDGTIGRIHHSGQQGDSMDGAAVEVAQRLFRSTLRGFSPVESRVSEVAEEDTEKGVGSTRTPQPMGPKIFLPETEKDLRVWVLEIFSGTAHLSKAMRQQGSRCAAWDIEYGPFCDVLQPGVLRSLLKFNSTHEVVLVWFGMPCQSWTRTRRWDGGPPPLRDDNVFLWGRNTLSVSDNSKVALGNVLLLWTCVMAAFCIELRIPYVIENPGSSRCWLTAPMKFLQQKSQLAFVDYCQYGVPWRKQTGLLMFGFSSLATVLRTCNTVHGRCSASHKRHVILVVQSKCPYIGQLT